jgi:hypothetical protein
VADLAERIGAEVIIFHGVGIDDQIIDRMVTTMVEPDPERISASWSA